MYAPENATDAPVMFYIYGGALLNGNGNGFKYPPGQQPPVHLTMRQDPAALPRLGLAQAGQLMRGEQRHGLCGASGPRTASHETLFLCSI